MLDLHTHSLLSDGVLLPSEVAVRYAACGYKTIAITDHADYSNIDYNIQAILKFTQHWPKTSKIKVLPGIELTHLPLSQFKPLAKYARDCGIKVIVAHGETTAEPVAKGTNKAALEADIDILAHPGLISDAEILLAKKRDIFLEVTSRHNHSETNSYLVEHALKIGAKLILNNDSHTPDDIIAPEELAGMARRCGLNQQELNKIYKEVSKSVGHV
ncbi:MAG: PHP domain-containing protein [Candidatus Omnitrophota bacterium]|nr:MAG: PHP domain-containing protein [Candidatus Omnitrophota bacterium]